MEKLMDAVKETEKRISLAYTMLTEACDELQVDSAGTRRRALKKVAEARYALSLLLSDSDVS